MQHGLFCSLYTNRGSQYFVTSEGGGRVSKTLLTQFGRALKQLGIEQIAAYSPQAPGRSERAFSTPQGPAAEGTGVGWDRHDRGRKPLARGGLYRRPQQAVRDGGQEGAAFVGDVGSAWRDILCIQDGRVVSNDNTVKWQRLSLQLSPSGRIS